MRKDMRVEYCLNSASGYLKCMLGGIVKVFNPVSGVFNSVQFCVLFFSLSVRWSCVEGLLHFGIVKDYDKASWKDINSSSVSSGSCWHSFLVGKVVVIGVSLCLQVEVTSAGVLQAKRVFWGLAFNKTSCRWRNKDIYLSCFGFQEWRPAHLPTAMFKVSRSHKRIQVQNTRCLSLATCMTPSCHSTWQTDRCRIRMRY